MSFDASFPADFICEGVDQTRGWFYSLHALGDAAVRAAGLPARRRQRAHQRQAGPEDVEVARQHRRSVEGDRRPRRRSAALVPARRQLAVASEVVRSRTRSRRSRARSSGRSGPPTTSSRSTRTSTAGVPAAAAPAARGAAAARPLAPLAPPLDARRRSTPRSRTTIPSARRGSSAISSTRCPTGTSAATARGSGSRRTEPTRRRPTTRSSARSRRSPRCSRPIAPFSADELCGRAPPGRRRTPRSS